jgi:kynureninase
MKGLKKNRHVNSIEYARQMDKKDPLSGFRKQFLFPKVKGKTSIYMIGNSLGLQPKTTKQFIKEELDDWATLAGEGHFHARRPWLTYHKLSKKILSHLTGGKPDEVVAMNQLTVNLHLMLVSFYNPTPKRYKILTESGAFPSDQYAFETQLKFHGIDPEDGLIEIEPRDGEYTIRTEDIISIIQKNADELALVILGGVQYYTGQFFEIGKITTAAHAAGAIAGFDLAHAIGNVPLQLHNDNVDFAVWCSYKYLNSGPGAIAGAFVHEKFSRDFSRPRFAGWWGHDEDERFQMMKGFKPMPGVDGWQLSNVPILQAAAHQASLEVFNKAGITRLRKKSLLLTGFLEFLLLEIDPEEKQFLIITPNDPSQRGCQLSILMKTNGKKIFSSFIRSGVIADWREPNVIRVAPAPLYNNYEDVFHFCEVFKRALK